MVERADADLRAGSGCRDWTGYDQRTATRSTEVTAMS